jgi:hypothetical protein
MNPRCVWHTKPARKVEIGVHEMPLVSVANGLWPSQYDSTCHATWAQVVPLAVQKIRIITAACTVPQIHKMGDSVIEPSMRPRTEW